MQGWTIRDSLELYSVPAWGRGFFDISERGTVEVLPRGTGGPAVDLRELVGDLSRRGLRTPLLIRFSDILASRVQGIAQLFERTIGEYEYRGRFRGVYPIKVNQQRHVVEEIISHGAGAGFGLEAGSKPELLIALALLDTPGALIICNGYKDRAYVETALLAQRLGRTPIIVIDRFHEIDLLIKTAAELGIRPHIGVRARLTTKGAGKWVESTGDKSKFGLSAREIVDAVERLRSEDMLDCLELLHFHIGSQITTIRAHKDALREASHIFVGLHKMGAEPRLVDVGGGLGVDYDGSQTNFHSSKNYSAQEYANDVVSTIQSACDEAEVPHPDLVTEAGRWMVAHHSVLVFDVLGVNEVRSGRPMEPIDEEDAKILQDLEEVWQSISRKNARECYHDAVQLKEDASTLFSLGQLDLRDRARVESLFWDCCQKILKIVREMPSRPRGSRGSGEGAGGHLLRKPVGLPERTRPLGGEAALPGHADPSARREAHPPRRLRRPDLRQRREDRPVHRPARREGRARAPRLERRALPDRHVPGGRLSGDSGRPPQSLRRHGRGSRAPRRG